MVRTRISGTPKSVISPTYTYQQRLGKKPNRNKRTDCDIIISFILAEPVIRNHVIFNASGIGNGCLGANTCALGRNIRFQQNRRPFTGKAEFFGSLLLWIYFALRYSSMKGAIFILFRTSLRQKRINGMAMMTTPTGPMISRTHMTIIFDPA